MAQRFTFDFDPRYLRILRALTVTPASSWAEVGEDLEVRFGRWHVRTPVANVRSVCVTGPYVPKRAIGPHLSLKDGGLSFGTNARRGICALFDRPIPGADPLGVLKHPGLTMTLEDLEGFAAALGHPVT